MEDFPDAAPQILQENSPMLGRPWFCVNDPCHTSFIQNILYEDSRTEVKVVDLFVAVKKVKDYVDFLSKCNCGLSKKIDELRKGTGVIRKEYSELLRNTEEFLDKVNDVKVWSYLIPQNTNEKNTKDTKEEPKSEENKFQACETSKEQKNLGENQDLEYLTTLLTKRIQEPIPEEFLGLLLASLLYLQKKQTQKDEPLTLESILETIHQTLNNTKHENETDDDQDWCSGISRVSSSRSPSPDSRDEISSCTDRSAFTKGKSVRLTSETISEAESEFEEALSEVSRPCEVQTKPSVNCMGDLTKAVKRKKSASTLTPTNTVASWLEKISDDLRTKVKTVKIIEEPHQRHTKPLHTLTKASQLALNAPLGLFDVTVVQFKKRRRSGSSKETKPSQVVNPILGPEMKDNSWSEESFQGSDFESVETGSVSSDDDMEEFLEFYLEKKKPEKKPVKPSTKGCLNRIIFKQDKSNFFEIQKCYPASVAQTFIRKFPKKGKEDLKISKSLVEDDEVIALNAGEKKEKQVVIQRSSEDLVIFIQVEVEGSSEENPENVVLEYQTNSLGTQTKESTPEYSPQSEVIKLEKEKSSGVSLFDIWNQFDDGEERNEINNNSIEPEKKEIVKEELQRKETTVTAAHVLIVKEPKQQAKILLPQRQIFQKLDIITPQQRISSDTIEEITANAVELDKALTLIRKIESDIVGVKLGDAISILPQLESELRKHLKSKMKDLEPNCSEMSTSVDNFFSALDFWPDEEPKEDSSVGSEERLDNLLKMLSNLEEAVRMSEKSKDNINLCSFSSSKIYKLLHALTVSIRELEERPSITSLSQTLDIASQLDTAVREYDSIIRKQPFDYISPERKSKKKKKSSKRHLDEVPAREHLKNVREKVFQIVEDEAVAVEERIERDFDRLDRLEKENDEALTFLEVFLQKTEKRVEDLSSLKIELQKLSTTLNSVYENLFQIVQQKKERKSKKEQETETKSNSKQEKETETEQKEKQEKETETDLETREEKETETEVEITKSIVGKKESRDRSVLTAPSNELTTAVEEKLVRETVSGLLVALDSLKTRAKEKHDVCLEILSSTTHETSRSSSRLNSIASFGGENPEQLSSTVKEFKKIGQTSLYLSWTKPEGPLRSSVAGYQIHIDGKLNQKVRNPERLQAVLYSVDHSNSTQLELYAVVENSSKILLAIVPLQPE